MGERGRDAAAEMPRLLQMQAFLSPVRPISVIIERVADCPEMAATGDAARTAHRSAELTPKPSKHKK